jgi:hypothetical protein
VAIAEPSHPARFWFGEREFSSCATGIFRPCLSA